MLSHSLDRFYIVAKFELPKVENLKLATFKFDFKCSYLTANSSENISYSVKLLKYCLKIIPYVQFTKSK